MSEVTEARYRGNESMNRADRLEAALRRIVDMERVNRYGFREPNEVFMDIDRIARQALDTEYPWPGEVSYNAPEDHAIARTWMEKHKLADEMIFIQGRPVAAMYFEPVSEHYLSARRTFLAIAQRLSYEWGRFWAGRECTCVGGSWCALHGEDQDV